MQRIKIPLGMLTVAQMIQLADLSEEYADGISHITTRQDVQYHFVDIDDTPNLMRRLAEVGITTREACGNVVRNVTGCPEAGVCSTGRIRSDASCPGDGCVPSAPPRCAKILDGNSRLPTPVARTSHAVLQECTTSAQWPRCARKADRKSRGSRSTSGAVLARFPTRRNSTASSFQPTKCCRSHKQCPECSHASARRMTGTGHG